MPAAAAARTLRRRGAASFCFSGSTPLPPASLRHRGALSPPTRSPAAPRPAASECRRPGGGGTAAAAAAVPVPARVPDQRRDHAAAGGGEVARRRGDVPPGPRLRGRAVPGRGRVPRGRRLRPALLRVVPVRRPDPGRTGSHGVQELGQVLLLPRGADDQTRAVRRAARFLPGGRRIRSACRASATGKASCGIWCQRLAFTGVAKVKCVIAISGAKIQAPVAAARAFNSKIMCPSLHFIGDDDFAKVHSEELVEAFEDPLVIRHPCGHTVPNLDEKGLQTMLTYLDKIEREIWEHSSTGYRDHSFKFRGSNI